MHHSTSGMRVVKKKKKVHADATLDRRKQNTLFACVCTQLQNSKNTVCTHRDLALASPGSPSTEQRADGARAGEKQREPESQRERERGSKPQTEVRALSLYIPLSVSWRNAPQPGAFRQTTQDRTLRWCCGCFRYRGTSRIRNRPPPRTTIGP